MMDWYGKGYISKDALAKAVDWDNDIGRWVIREDDYDSLQETPSADVVEVVRCKDCEYFRPWADHSKLGDCMVYVCELEEPFTMEETDFCSDGERRS